MVVLFYRFSSVFDCLEKLYGFVGSVFIGLTYHVGVNTVSPCVRGFSPIINGVG